jgi:hypothetical protein
VDLLDGIRRRVREGRLERALEEALDDPVDDGEAQSLLALEVVIEVALADPAFP